MSDLNKPREIIFATGQVAYAAPGHGFQLKDDQDREIPIVSEKPLTEQEIADKQDAIADPSTVKGEQVEGGWQVVPKTADEIVAEGIDSVVSPS